MVTLDDMANALGFKTPQDVKGFAAYGEVKGINADETYQVSLNGSTTTVKCARLAGAHVGDVVLVTVLNNGYAVVTGCVGGDKDALEALEKAGATLQHFWHDLSGAHVTEVTQEEYLDDPENAGGNTLITSDGMAIRDGTKALASFGATESIMGPVDSRNVHITADGLGFYDKTNDQGSLLFNNVDVYGTSYKRLMLQAINSLRDSYANLIEIVDSNTMSSEVQLNAKSNNTYYGRLRLRNTSGSVIFGRIDSSGTDTQYSVLEFTRTGDITVNGHAQPIGYTKEDVATNNLANTTALAKLSDLATLEAGTWIVNASIRFTNSTSGSRAAELHNGSTAIGASYVAGPANGVVALNLNAVISSDNPIDLDIYARQNSGAAMSINTYWQAVRIL